MIGEAANENTEGDASDLVAFQAALTRLRSEGGWGDEYKKASEQLEEELKKVMTSKASSTDQRRDLEKADRTQLEQALKLLKVMSFLSTNRTLISE